MLSLAVRFILPDTEVGMETFDGTCRKTRLRLIKIAAYCLLFAKNNISLISFSYLFCQLERFNLFLSILKSLLNYNFPLGYNGDVEMYHIRQILIFFNL